MCFSNRRNNFFEVQASQNENVFADKDTIIELHAHRAKMCLTRCAPSKD